MNHNQSDQTELVSRLDIVGGAVAFVCAIHCFVAPLLIVMLPLAWVNHFADESFHTFLVVGSVSLAFISLAFGARFHKNYILFVLPLLATFLFMLPLWYSDHFSEAFCMGIAGLLLVAMHIINKNLCTSCRKCSHSH